MATCRGHRGASPVACRYLAQRLQTPSLQALALATCRGCRGVSSVGEDSEASPITVMYQRNRSPCSRIFSRKQGSRRAGGCGRVPPRLWRRSSTAADSSRAASPSFCNNGLSWLPAGVAHTATATCTYMILRMYRYKQVLSDSFARTAPLLKGFSLCQKFFGRPQENYLGLRTG